MDNDVAIVLMFAAVLIIGGLGGFFVTRHGSRLGWLPVVVATACALLAIAALVPKECFSTLIGIPPGGPDPNGAGCSTFLITSPSWASLGGGHPETDEETDTVDLLKSRLHTAAAVAAIVILTAGLLTGRLVARRGELSMKRKQGSANAP